MEVSSEVIAVEVSVYVCGNVVQSDRHFCHVTYSSCIMALSKYEEILLGVLKEKGNVIPFLDVVFGFLYKW